MPAPLLPAIDSTRLPRGVWLRLDPLPRTLVLGPARWAQQPSHLRAPGGRYALNDLRQRAALALVHADLAAPLGLDGMACLQALGVLRPDSTRPQDALDHAVLAHLADGVRHNRMVARYPTYDLPGDDGDPRAGWLLSKYHAHDLAAYAAVIGVDWALWGQLPLAAARWRPHWLGPQTAHWASALREELRQHCVRTGQRVELPADVLHAPSH